MSIPCLCLSALEHTLHISWSFYKYCAFPLVYGTLNMPIRSLPAFPSSCPSLRHLYEILCLASLSQQAGLAGWASWEVSRSAVFRCSHPSGSHQLFLVLEMYEVLLTGNVWFQCCWQVSDAVVCMVEPEIPSCTDVVLGFPKQVSYLL